MGKPISLWTDEVAMARPNVPEVPVYEAPKTFEWNGLRPCMATIFGRLRTFKFSNPGCLNVRPVCVVMRTLLDVLDCRWRGFLRPDYPSGLNVLRSFFI